MKKEIITTLNAPAPIGPYNQAVKTGNTLYISGQIPLKASSMELLNGTIKEETQLVMENLQSILDAAGMTFENVVKSSIFIDDMKKVFPTLEDDWGIYIPEVKYLSPEPLVDYTNLALTEYPNVHFVGDALSARGITVSGAQGTYVAEAILDN